MNNEENKKTFKELREKFKPSLVLGPRFVLSISDFILGELEHNGLEITDKDVYKEVSKSLMRVDKDLTKQFRSGTYRRS